LETYIEFTQIWILQTKLLTACISGRGMRGTTVVILRLVRNSVLEQGGKCVSVPCVLQIERGWSCFTYRQLCLNIF